MRRKIIAILAIMVLILPLVGCGISRAAEARQSLHNREIEIGELVESRSFPQEVESTEMVAYEGEDAEPGVETTENATNSNRKLIKTVSLDVETKEYDNVLNDLIGSTVEMGGYVEYMDVQNFSERNSNRSERSALVTVRIPSDNLYDFINVVGDNSNIVNRIESVEDVTLTYVDMESHRDMLIAERDNLLEYLEQAETIEEMITIEDRLTEVRYLINSMESQLRTYDNLVDYSTVNITLYEVVEYTPPTKPTYTFWERVTSGFKENLEEVKEGFKESLISFLISIPHLVKWVIIIVVIVFIINGLLRLFPSYRARLKKKKAIKKEQKEAKRALKEGTNEIEKPSSDIKEVPPKSDDIAAES